MTRQIKIGQRKQGKDLCGVLGQTPIAHLAIAPQVLDHPKGMFDPGADAVALGVKGAIRTTQSPAAVRLAQDTLLHRIRPAADAPRSHTPCLHR